MHNRKFAAAALAILAFAAASPAFAQRGSGGDDLLIGGQTGYKAAATQAGGSPATRSDPTTTTDDVIVDGPIITGENPASATGPYPGFTGGIRVATGDVNGAPGGAKGKAAKGNANGTPHRGGANFVLGDGSVKFNKGGSPGALKGAGSPPAQVGGNGRDLLLGGAGGDQDAAAAGPAFPGGIRLSSGDVNDAPASGGSRHTGGVNVLMGDGSVRNSVGGNKTETIGIAKTDTVKATRLGSLNGVGSLGQIANPAGTPSAQAQNNLKQLGLAVHNTNDSSTGGGDVNGDGVGDIIVGSGPQGHVKSGAAGGAGPHVKVFDAGRAAGPKTGGATHVKVFDGNTARGSASTVKTVNGGNAAAAAAGASKNMTMKGQTIKQN